MNAEPDARSTGQTAHRPRKRFGQHFLHDRGVLARIVAAIDPQPADALVEIGPGEGALTEPLLARLRDRHAEKHDGADARPATNADAPNRAFPGLDVIEIDRDLVARLHSRQLTALRIHRGDALAFDFAALAAERRRALRLVGNLPYNVSTPLIARLFAQHAAWRDAHFLLQREVVDRLTANPGSSAYGRLALLVALHGHAERLFDVGPGAFSPPPKVDSALVRIRLHDAPRLSGPDRDRLLALAKHAFGQRRKTLGRSLRARWRVDFDAACVDPGARPETLDLDAWCALVAHSTPSENR